MIQDSMALHSLRFIFWAISIFTCTRNVHGFYGPSQYGCTQDPYHGNASRFLSSDIGSIYKMCVDDSSYDDRMEQYSGTNAAICRVSKLKKVFNTCGSHDETHINSSHQEILVHSEMFTPHIIKCQTQYSGLKHRLKRRRQVTLASVRISGDFYNETAIATRSEIPPKDVPVDAGKWFTMAFAGGLFSAILLKICQHLYRTAQRHQYSTIVDPPSDAASEISSDSRSDLDIASVDSLDANSLDQNSDVEPVRVNAVMSNLDALSVESVDINDQYMGVYAVQNNETSRWQRRNIAI